MLTDQRRASLSGVLMLAMAVSPSGFAWAASPSSDDPTHPAAARADVTDLPSLSGASGLFHTSTASPVRSHTLRLALHGQFSSTSGFLVPGDENQQLRRELAWAYSPDSRLELFGAWLSSSNHNRRTRQAGDVDPEVINAVGDLTVGAKGWLPLLPVLNGGFEVGLKLESGASDLLWSPSATSWWLGPMATLNPVPHSRFPFRAHLGVSYFADHTGNLSRLSPASLASRRVAAFAYGIGRSRLTGTIAVDLPWSALVPAAPVTGLVFLEYGWEYTTGSADTTFPELLPPLCGASAGASPCSDRRSAHRLTLGLRGAVYRNLVAELGLDLVVGSAAQPYGAPLPPHNLIFGLAYPLDLDGWFRHERAPSPAVAPAVGAADGGERGVVAAAPSPEVPAATAPPSRSPSASPSVPPPASAATVGPTSSRLPALPPLLPLPSASAHPRVMLVRGRVVDPTGRGLQAALVVRGAQQSFESVSDAQGAFELSLLPGSHRIRVQSPGFELQELQMDALAGTETSVEVRLQPPSLDPNAQLEARAIKLGRAVRFVNGGTALTADSQTLLKSVGEVLGAHPEISLVRIVAHWDDSLPKAAAEELTLKQAEAVRAFLVGRGIAESRMVAEGAGGASPLVPSANPLSRLRNRRVEFQIAR